MQRLLQGDHIFQAFSSFWYVQSKLLKKLNIGD
ncbi:MAG: hypothetical protein ACI9NN_001891 [Bacteroidia bacterium]